MKYLFLTLLFISNIAFGSKILKNNTASPVFITDTGVTVPASGQYTILATEDFIFCASSDVIIFIADLAVSPSVSTLTVNDGTSDLSISDGTDLIKGLYPKEFKILGDTDDTKIGNVGDRLKVETQITSGSFEHDFFFEIARGNVANFSAVNKFGHNDTVSNTTLEDMWSLGDLYPWPSSAATVNVKSDDADDTSAGTGARTVRLEGLDSSYDEINETITMNGLTNVLSTNSYLRLHRIYAVTAGSSEFNEGDITATHTGSSDVIAIIDAERNQTLMAIYTIPNDKTGYITDYYFSTENDLPSTSFLFCRGFNGNVFRVKHHLEIATSLQYHFKVPIKVPAKSDIRMAAQAQTGSHAMAAGFTIVLFDGVE